MKDIPPRESRIAFFVSRDSRLNIWYSNDISIHHASRVCLKDERVSWVSISQAALSFTEKITEWKIHKSGKALKNHLAIFNSFPHKKLLDSSEMHVQSRFMHFPFELLSIKEKVSWEWQKAKTMAGFLMEAADKLLASTRITLASSFNGFSRFLGKMSIFGNVTQRRSLMHYLIIII